MNFHKSCFCYLPNFFGYILFQKIPILSYSYTTKSSVYRVKVTAKKAKKTVKKTLKATITVKNPTLSVSAADVVAIGATETVKTTVKPAKATVSYKSSDETIATVDAKGVVTGVKAGDVTITVSAKSGNKTVSKDVKMTVKKAILKDVKQTEVTKVVATVLGDTKDLKAADFKITNTATNATVAVKSATADKNDATKVTIETFTEMKDAKEYTVVYDNVTVKFTATDATPSKVGIDTVQIPAAKTKVQATLTDANGVILGRTPLDQADSSKGKVTSAVTLTKGYQDGTQIYLPAVGDTATIKVTYHTGTFGTDGKETGNIEDTFTVTAVDPSAVNLSYAMTISNNAPAWTAASFQANNKVAMGANKSAYIRITKDDGTEISNYSDYKVESADKTKLLVTETALTDSKTGIAVRGVAEGTTYILITKDGKAVYSLPVTVVGKPVATTLDLGKTSATVMADKDVEEVASVTLKDQYGDSMSVYTLTSDILSKPEGSTKTGSIGTTDSANNKYVVKGTDFDKTGTYQIKLTAKKDSKELARTFTVTVVKSEATAQSYELKVSALEVDTTVGKDDTVEETSKAITLSVVRKANGAAIDEMSGAVAYTIKNAKGDVVYDATHTKAYVDDATAGKLTVKPYTVDGKNIKKNLAAGTYSVQATFEVNTKKVVVNGTFTIKDTQDTRVSFNILDNKFGDNTVAAAFALPGDAKKVKVFYDGVEQDNTKLNAQNVKGVALTSGGAYIKTVDVYVNVSGGDNYVLVTLNVNDQLASVNNADNSITE